MYRAPKCPNCRRNYAGPHVQGGSFQPLILKCGHTFCQACLARIYKYLKHELVCPQCKVSTPLPAGEVSFKELPPDFYALGQAAWTYNNKTPDFFAHKVEFQTRQEKKFKGKALKGGRALCEECSQESASCQCEQCDEELCDKCWSKLHKNNSKSKNPHHRIQIQIGVYGCEEHDNMPREFYCKDDDKPICAYCGLTGEHKGHQIISIGDQNANVQDLLKPAFDIAKDVLKKLYYSNVSIDKAITKVKRESSPASEEIRSRFLNLHALLQRRETMLLQELSDSEADRLHHLGQMERSLKNNISRLETVMSDVANSLQDSSDTSPNLTEMISILNSASELPCHVIQDGGQDEPIGFKSGNEIVQHVMTHGSIDTTGRTSWDLKTQDELPADYVQPKIADAILNNSKLFSISSAGKSELKTTSAKGKGEQKKAPKTKNHIASQNGTTSPSQLQTSTTATRRTPSQAASKIMASCSAAAQNLVYVVHIRSPARFYIQRKSDRPRLARMMKTLYKVCESEDKKKRIPDPLVVGLRCCCKFSVDKQWYRAIIKTLPDHLQGGGQSTLDPDDVGDEEKEPKVEVTYIDYGNTEWVPVSSLCKIRAKYEREPDMALCCSLVDIVSTQKDGRWPREASEAFQAMVEGQEAVLMSQRGQVGNVLYVDLHQQPNNDIKDDMPISLRDALVFLELACFISPESVPKSHLIVPPKKYLPPTIPSSGDDLLVQVSHITDPQCFSVQEMEIVPYLDEMMKNIQGAYAKRIGHEWQVLCPHPGLVCMAFFQEDKRWYRAEVLRAAGKQQVEVLYVDYGNTAIIHYTHLKKMTDDFLKLYRLSLPCGLVDVAPKDEDKGWTDEAKLVFSQCVSFKPLDVSVMDLEDGVIHVIAYDEVEEQRVSVNALLVKKGLAETTGPGSVSAEILRGLSPKPTPVLPSTTDTTKPSHTTHNVDSSGDKVTAESVPAETDETSQKAPEPKQEVPSPETKQEVKSPETVKVPEKKPARSAASAARSSRGSSLTVGCSGTPGHSSQLSGKYSAYTAVHVSHAEAPSCIYVQLSTAGKDGLDSLLEAMTLFYKEQTKCEKTKWKEGEICGALLVREGVWCRGQIQCILPDENAVVLFTDYGNEEVVSIANIRPLEERFQKEAPFAIRCHLVDILPAGGTPEWTKTSCDFLEERLNDLECYIYKKGDAEDGSLPIDLLYELTTKEKVARESAEDLASIAELLVEKGLALRKRRKVSSPTHRLKVTTPQDTAKTPPSQRPTTAVTTTTTVSPKTVSTPATPQSSGVSSLNTTASPTSVEAPTTPDEGCPAMLLDDFENFEGSGIQEVLPRYPAPPLPMLSQIHLIVTYVSDKGVIHGLDVDKFEDFQQMMAAQQVACNSQKLTPPDPSSLSLCQCVCARFTQDEQWYRAQIIGITEDTVRVRYVDFGNWESLPFDRINPKPFQLDVPQYSRECVLYGIQPKSPSKSWSADAISFLLESLVEKTCLAYIRAICVKDEPLTVELTLPTGESVVRLMLNKGFAELLADCEDLDDGTLDDASTITDGTSTPAFSRAMSEDGEDGAHYNPEIPRSVVNVLKGVTEAVEMEEGGAMMAAPGQAFRPTMLPDVGVYFWVTVSHLDEPDLLYIQYTQTNEDDPDPIIAQAAQHALESEELVAELAIMAPHLPFLLNPQPDMPCCAQYSVDERWYRAEIIEVVRKDIIMCHVRFVDYGTVEWLSLNSIRQLPAQFLDLPLQCRRCRLTGIQVPAKLPPKTPLQSGTQWPAAAIKRVVDMVSNRILVAAVEEDSPIPMISLYESTTQTLPIYYSLIQEGLADGLANSEELLVNAAFKEVGLILSAREKTVTEVTGATGVASGDVSKGDVLPGVSKVAPSGMEE